MKVTLNNDSHEVTPDTTLISFLQKLGQEPKAGMAVAINDEVVPSSEWSERLLEDGDRILLIQATQGG
ncbi:sulfur carrier protein ThiS [Puniceicoccus vermicola]|uniref:Sulfur carrier protein ThiS n=1 Tax=Puniceicoccus vermicola TaxID=388746 RepID=A0A7X1B0R6_9BACT|nr:sulfur carrier protein ThiS [Puniceicoccus vermicola]MBC2603511.1 sulfur carrier protein ThiS [Puniceicoccus vermicola]